MKNTILFTAVLVLSFFTARSQTGYNITDVNMYPNSNTTYYCDSIIDIAVGIDSLFGSNAKINTIITGTNFQQTNLEVTVYWGDGNSTLHNGVATGAGSQIQFSPSISHFYNANGSYDITLMVENPANGMNFGDTIDVTVGANCYYQLSSFIQVDCDSNGTVDSTIDSNVPFIISSNSGNQTYNGTLFNNNAFFIGIPPGYYSYEIDPVWLSNHGYNAYYSPNNQNIYIDSLNTPLTTQVNLFCNDSISNSTQNCFAGQVYCDDNQNGVYDGGEAPVGNAPVNIYPYWGSSYTVYTDANGYFQTSYSANSGQGQNYVIAQVNGQWLQQNGYGSTYSVDTIYNTTCDNTLEVANLPVDCPSNNIDTACVSGYVFCDANGNFQLDSVEATMSNAPVILNIGQNNVTVYTDSFGYFSYCDIQLSPGMPITAHLDSNWVITHGYTDLTGLFTLQASSSPQINNIGFALDCGGGTASCADFWVNVTPWIGYYQNYTNKIKLNWGSYGPAVAGSYEVSLTFPNGVSPVLSSINNLNYTISGNTITWTLNSSSSSFSFTDIIYFDTPSGIPSGTSHHFVANITPLNGGTDCCAYNNASCLLQIVGNSYDPNDKLVDQPEVINPNEQDTLTYTVRFQNTGTAPAQDVYILDTISNKLDLSTMQIISTSHHMNLVEMGNNVMKFDFPQIWLPDSNANEPASHGYVTYRIMEKANNSIGDEIENTAHIFFDWNPAIVTNTTYNINMEGGSIEEEKLSSVAIFPNPSNGLFNVKAESKIETIMVMNINGKLIQNVQPISNQSTVDLSESTNGIYIIKVKTGNQTTVHKLIKQ